MGFGAELPETLFYKESDYDVMPIITPAFPAANATHGVSQSTKAALLTEY